MKSINTKQLYLMIFFAYIFSLIVRYLYIYQQGGNPEFLWNGSYIINTNDGYYFASGVQKALYGMHQYNPLTPELFGRGLTFFTTILAKILPFSLDSIIFYLPAIISSLIVIPVILISNLYKEPLWGFFSALIIAIAWSYYNRTMLGYYDTDMFSIMILIWITYFLLKTTVQNSVNAAFIGALLIAIYPFFYESGRMITYAVILFFSAYTIWDKKADKNSLQSVSLVLLSAVPITFLATPWKYILSISILTIIYFLFKKIEINKKMLTYFAIISFLILFFQGDIFGTILSKVTEYIHTGVDTQGLKFFGVFQTIAEANGIPFFSNGQVNSVANRTIGSSLIFILAAAGYLYLLYKRKEFIIFLPLLGIGIFSHWGGLRFTIYASPILILSVIFLLYNLTKIYIKDKKMQILTLSTISIAILYSNIYHAWEYNKAISPVFKRSEIVQLDNLKKTSNSKDYTLSWWDYGYPIWYYTDTNTLIDGGKHRQDNFIIASILLSNSSVQAANLARLSIEEYVKGVKSYKEWVKNGAKVENIPQKYKFVNNNIAYHAGHPFNPVINLLLKNNQKDQKDPNEFMASLDDPNYKLPTKTRDIYLYMPIKSIRIFPVITQFANLDLATGKKLRDILFYSSYIRDIKNGNFILANGIRVDGKSGAINLGNNLKLNRLIEVEYKKDGTTKLSAFSYNNNGNISFLYLKSLGMGIVLDNETLNSNYVKMFLLGIYDKNIFELVDNSVYGKVYKFKR